MVAIDHHGKKQYNFAPKRNTEINGGVDLAFGGTRDHVDTLVGILSAVVDNIPVMFAVLTMDPAMSLGQWRPVTLTAGVGPVETARGIYTFGAHLKLMPVIALGYGASIEYYFLNQAH